MAPVRLAVWGVVNLHYSRVLKQIASAFCCLITDNIAALAAAAVSGPLAVWVVANLHYSRVLKQIAPLEGQLNKLKVELTESQDRLKQCQEELMALDEQVRPLADLPCVSRVVLWYPKPQTAMPHWRWILNAASLSMMCCVDGVFRLSS